jgi:hypothetical protein
MGGTPRWEFRCGLYGTKTLNTRGLEPRKLEDKEGKGGDWADSATRWLRPRRLRL